MLLHCSHMNSPVWPGVQRGVEAAINLHSVLRGSSYWILLRRTTFRQVPKTPSLLNLSTGFKFRPTWQSNVPLNFHFQYIFAHFPSVGSGFIIWFPTLDLEESLFSMQPWQFRSFSISLKYFHPLGRYFPSSSSSMVWDRSPTLWQVLC